MDYTPENITGLLIRSKLLSADQVKSLYDRWKVEGKKENIKSAPHYLKWIVTQNHLTTYQAALIARGQPDNFFLGPYKILDRLGKGRMAGVYKAVHTLGQTVAIKIMPPSRAKDPDMLARFQREARLAVQLKHPNVVRSFHMDKASGLHFLVMEHLDGETLEDILNRRKKLPTKEAVRLIYQALQGLQHIHEKGLVHRDVKPANLMLVPSRAASSPDTTVKGTVKILDIGLGRELFDESAQAAVQSLELTGEGVLLGTPDYLAPEQARDPRTIDIRADLYSLGCVLYHCLAGRPPFPDSNVLNQMVRHATETPKPIKELTADVPDGLQQVLNWMLAKNPDERYPSPERAAKALHVFMVAGSDVQRIEELPNMRRFLTWLETEKPNEAKEPPKAIPVGKPKADPVSPNDKADKRISKKEKRRRRSALKSQKDKTAKDKPIHPKDLDVELVSLPAPSATTAPAPAKGLTRRDWLLMGIGASAVVFALLLGFVLARVYGG